MKSLPILLLAIITTLAVATPAVGVSLVPADQQDAYPSFNPDDGIRARAFLHDRGWANVCTLEEPLNVWNERLDRKGFVKETLPVGTEIFCTEEGLLLYKVNCLNRILSLSSSQEISNIPEVSEAPEPSVVEEEPTEQGGIKPSADRISENARALANATGNSILFMLGLLVLFALLGGVLFGGRWLWNKHSTSHSSTSPPPSKP